MAQQTMREEAGGFLGLGVSSAGELIGVLIGKIPLLVIAVLVLFMSMVVAKFLARMVKKSVLRQDLEEVSYAADMLGKSTYYFTFAIGITVALKIVNIDISVIMGAFTFGLGFAMKDMISNYIAGIWILLSRMFKIGDLVEIPSDDIFGTVERIETRSTELRTFNGQKVVVPNSVIFTNAVSNYTSNPERRVVLDIGLHYETDLQLARETVSRVLNTEQRVLQYPKYDVLFRGFDSSSVIMQVKFWIDPKSTSYFRIYSDMLQQIKAAFDEVGITIPYPMRTVVFENTSKRSSGDRAKLASVSAIPPQFISDKFPKEQMVSNEAETNFAEAPQVPSYAAAPKEETQPTSQNNAQNKPDLANQANTQVDNEQTQKQTPQEQAVQAPQGQVSQGQASDGQVAEPQFPDTEGDNQQS